jgi:tellurite resistance protein TehA-like permease
MERVTSKAGWVFHVVRFHSENNSQENFEDMKNFISLIPESLTCFRTLPRPE